MIDLDKIKKTIDKHQLIEIGDKIVVAVSGGPDSVCLLHILNELKETYDIKLYGAHLNHNFRGIEAQKDAQYVAKLCEDLKIMCFIKSIDVTQHAKEHGYTLEEAGRILRYQFFDEVSEKVGAHKISVAHNLNDQAETLLMRMLRGTGIQGLTAIHHRRDKIIRPLLDVNRNDIEEYCKIHGLAPRIDHTNLQPIYHRNKIRLELIPSLEEYNPNITETLAKTAELLKMDSDFIDLQANDIYNLLIKKDKVNRLTFPIHGINKLHPSLLTRILRLAAEDLVGKREVLEYKHIQSLTELIQKDVTGKRVELPMGITVFTNYEKLVFTTEKEGNKLSFSYFLKDDTFTDIPEIDGRIGYYIIKRDQLLDIPKDIYKKAFDWDKIKGKLIVRNRRDGDRFWPLGMNGTKKLKDLFIDYKVERYNRDRIPLLCDEDEIIWVIGYRISDLFKVTKATERILIIEFEQVNNA
ncbi:tRNA lysidine(34) synthetase TilS [Alkaliphilus peptidifermentans]|uniref:tRNA(Ile)-lysidine synthase n=1 Tax=Alkaliphilus peptidifermentans DSM 18978 TaxID=1120976 RepID=A0A1G5KIR9_9FIRM|nr:tRNA lysidine(34) synthetase TilS [Alkaliphilus peptidifermentans]SCY99839.1 tRNA(Ile)-lysidine synthase [Alkaliphilus peptidifermentans DSM 18978]